MTKDKKEQKVYLDFIFAMIACALVSGMIIILLNKVITLPFTILFFVYIVVFTTLITMALRRSLYEHLQDSNTEKKALSDLKSSFNTASQSLETVNTHALIEDEFYSKEKFNFFNFKVLCEKWDYFTRILPNLLIAFGLLGTFWGITYNLSGIVEVLNPSQSSDTISLEDLQVPLKSMGIAFTSSLVGLFCSMLITVTNFIWNTTLAKNNLFSYIENELDNVEMKTAQGETRLSKAVNKMVVEQGLFLTRFHQEVSSAIKSAFEEVAEQMARQNEKANDSIKTLSDGFSQSSTRVGGAAIQFEASTTKFSEQISHFSKEMDNLKIIRGFIAQSASQFEQATTQLQTTAQTLDGIQLSAHISNLTEETKNLKDIQDSFSKITQFLCEHIEQSKQNNQKFYESSEQIFVELQKSSAQWQDGSIVFLESAELLTESQFAKNLVQSSENIANAHQTFSQSLEHFNESLTLLNRYTEEFKSLTQRLSSLGEEVTAQNQLSSQLLEANQGKIDHEITLFNEFSHQTATLLTSFEQTQSKLDGTLGQVGKQVSQSVENNRAIQQSILVEFQKRTSHLAGLLSAQIENIQQSLANSLSDQSNQLKSLTDGALTQIGQHNQAIITLLNNIQYTQMQNNEELKSANLASGAVADRLTQDIEKTLTTLKEFQEHTGLLAGLLNAQIEKVEQSLTSSYDKQSNQLQSLTDGALTQLGQQSQSIITLLNGIQYAQTQNNEELKNANLASGAVAERLTQDTEKNLAALNALQMRMAQLSEANQTQNGAVLNNLSTQIQNYQNTLRQILAQIAQTGEKSQVNLENLKKLDQTLESLTAIRSEMTKLTTLLETQAKTGNLSPDLIDLIKTLKRR